MRPDFGALGGNLLDGRATLIEERRLSGWRIMTRDEPGRLFTTPTPAPRFIQRLSHAPTAPSAHGAPSQGSARSRTAMLEVVQSPCRSGYNKNAVPFVWTKAKVRQRRFKNRRISQL